MNPAAHPRRSVSPHGGARRSEAQRGNGPRAILLVLGFCSVAWGAIAEAAVPVARGLFLDVAYAGEALVAVGEYGTILRSTDEGKTWTAAATPPGTATLTALAFADATHGWAAGHDATILATTDAGLTWSLAHRGADLEDSFLDLVVLPGTTASPTAGPAARVLAVGAFGLALASDDAGRTWTKLSPQASDLHLNHLMQAARPPGALLLVGESATLLRSRDAGHAWQALDSPYDGSFHGSLALPDGTLLAYGLRGHILRSTDHGDTWTEVGGQVTALLATGAVLSDGRVLLAGGARAWLESRDAGQTFTPLATPLLTTAVAQLLVLRDGTLLACGEAGLSRVEIRSAK